VSASRARRLEVVLRLRRLAEDRAKAEFVQAANRLAAARAGQAAAARRIVGEQDFLAHLHARSATGGELVEATTCLSIAEELAEAARSAVSVAVADVGVARSRLADATRDRDVVERLRDRALEAERIEAERREIADLSELAGVRHAWRIIGGDAS
jgi:flagellar export protein FliJ